MSHLLRIAMVLLGFLLVATGAVAFFVARAGRPPTAQPELAAPETAPATAPTPTPAPQLSPIAPRVPLLDAGLAARTETATFALG
jgi:hypothetical protein